jgi:hypothetical protein
MKAPSTGLVWMNHQGRYVIWRIKAYAHLLFPYRMAVFRHFLRDFGRLDFLVYSPLRYLARCIPVHYIPRTPLRYLAQTATLSGANRYVIWRKRF